LELIHFGFRRLLTVEQLHGTQNLVKTANPNRWMMSSLRQLQIFEVRSVEELTQEWLRDKLAFFD
jgi:hypothetical protein